MSDIFKKLNLKDRKEILWLNAPESFEPELASLNDVAICRSIDNSQHIVCSLAFVTKQTEVDNRARAIAQRAEYDAILWFAYPKASSKNYTCEFSHDTGWAMLGELGFEGVRQVAIDADWSALRFRRVEFIKTIRRAKHRRLTEQGKKSVSRINVNRCLTLLQFGKAIGCHHCYRGIARAWGPAADRSAASHSPLMGYACH